MKQIIVAFGGAKQSGKDSSANFLSGLLLTKFGRINDFILKPDSAIYSGDSKIEVNSVDPLLLKTYSFADALKEFAVNILNLKREQVYGSDEEKNSLTHIKWEDMPGIITDEETYKWLIKTLKRKSKLDETLNFEDKFFYHEAGFMTGREVMQFFGTDIVRKLYEPAWRESTIKRIFSEAPAYSFIKDLRFVDEFKELKNSGACCVKLLRDIAPNDEKHSSENDFLSIPDYEWDLVIDNRDGDINKLKQSLINGMRKIDVLNPRRFII